MTTRSDLERSLGAWFRADAGDGTPDYLDDIVDRVASERQRAWWSSPERWLPVESTLRLAPAPRVAWALLILVLIVAIVAAVAIVGAPRRLPAPFGPALNGQILSWDGNDIFVSEADGSNRHALIADRARDFGAWHTHDGTKFTFQRETGDGESLMMIANADGSGVSQLLEEPFTGADWVEWSPQDDRLAIVQVVEGRRVLSILDLATRSTRQLPIPGLEVDYNAKWRPPDGEELLFTARPDGDASTGAALYAIRPDGTGFRTVVPERTEEWPFLNLEASPDGRTVTYWMYEAIPGGADPHARIHLVDLETTEDRQVVFDPTNVEESELRFSPDGRSGVILSATGSATLQLVSVADLESGPAIGPRLAGNEAKVTGFSPDGKTVVLAIDNRPPSFIDVASGEVTTVKGTWSRFDSWQRLAP